MLDCHEPIGSRNDAHINVIPRSVATVGISNN